ncbi:hypothetical protein SDC9_182356 [bioreactor metagenome]|uniref:Uncharacterized protein n=1 Tax=bioreactor metagenome TaxID=1076179 RepID=A0A645H922_9ZZZZ
MSGGVAQIQQASLAEHDDRMTVGEIPPVDLRLDAGLADAVQLGESGHVDFVVEVPNVPHDGEVLHPGHLRSGDHLQASSRSDEDVGLLDHIVQGGNLIAVHGRLQRTNRIDLGDDDTGTLTGQ